MHRSVAKVWVGLLLVSSVGIGRNTTAADLVGAERCATCHPEEHKQWKKTGHAIALARLSQVQQRDRTCRSCHTASPTNERTELLNVQCESCHGAGEFYSPKHVMRDKEFAKLLGLRPINEDTCKPCHSQDTPSVRPFDFTTKVELVRHRPKKKEKKAARNQVRSPSLAAK